ncbi:hypothetical protein LEP1GSC072_3718 [Leptospira noguchii str. Bonito]|nr:hypothetical protein LEP1GSC072_3718 [Leptospira noguchii str. Bonito]
MSLKNSERIGAKTNNSASHSPWVVRQVALTQQNAFLRVAF